MQPVLLAFMTILGLSNAALVSSPTGSAVPEGLVLDIRVFEARSGSPDFQAMGDLSFFIKTDGGDVSERQWLATIASKVSDSFLASLAFEITPTRDGHASFGLVKRSRKLATRVDLTGFLERGTFEAPVTVRLQRGDKIGREFQKTVELQLDQTSVFSSPDLELSASEYLSHLRDYEDRDHRGELYERLRASTIFLIIALTPRIETDGGSSSDERTTLVLPADVDLPELESPYNIPLVGSILLYFDVDASGTPQDITIARSSLTEVNPRIVGEASTWRFPEAAGEKARLVLELRAEATDGRR